MPLLIADAIFWIAVVLCAVAEVAIVRSALVVRPTIQGGASLPPVRRAIEVVWSVVPAIALMIVLALTWRAIHQAPDDGRPAAVTIGGTAL